MKMIVDIRTKVEIEYPEVPPAVQESMEPKMAATFEAALRAGWHKDMSMVAEVQRQMGAKSQTPATTEMFFEFTFTP